MRTYSRRCPLDGLSILYDIGERKLEFQNRNENRPFSKVGPFIGPMGGWEDEWVVVLMGGWRSKGYFNVGEFQVLEGTKCFDSEYGF